MARVPTYDEFQVQQGTLPQAGIRPAEVQDVAGPAGRAMGVAIQQASAPITAEVQKKVDEFNRLRVTDALNQAVKAQLALQFDAPNEAGEQPGFTHLKGRSALEREDGRSLEDEYSERLRKALEKIEGGLTNDAQRLAYRERASAIARQFSADVLKHVSAEHAKYQDVTLEDTIKTAARLGTLNWGDPTKLAEARTVIKNAVAERAALMGFAADSPTAKQMEVEALSGMHTIVTMSAVDAGKTDYAKEYYAQVSEELDPRQRLELTRALDAGAFEEQGQKNTEQALAASGGSIAKAREWARANLSGKDEDAVITRLNARQAEANAGRAEADRALNDRVAQMVLRGEPVPLSMLLSLGNDGVKWKDYLDKKAEEAASGVAINTDREKFYDFISKPAAEVANLTPADIYRDYGTVFSEQDLRTAIQFVSSAREAVAKRANQDGLQLATVNQVIENTAVVLGILPKPGEKPSRSQVDRFMAFQNEFQKKLEYFEASTASGKATEAELLELAQRMKEETVFKPGFLFFDDKEVSVWGLNEEDFANAYVTVTDETTGAARRVRLGDIPLGYRAEKKARGFTELEIAAMWAALNPLPAPAAPAARTANPRSPRGPSAQAEE